jgi:hypothetical protein
MNRLALLLTYIPLSIILGLVISNNQASDIICDEKGCRGTYQGPEFVDGSDIAHQFSNAMSHDVGVELKSLYNKGLYSKVDFSKLKMSTKGMGSGTVVYELDIPFIRVDEKCDAYTSFDHVGGWNHKPALNARKQQLSSALLKGDSLDISQLKVTPEGLQEYWIQWKNKSVQADCVSGSKKAK